MNLDPSILKDAIAIGAFYLEGGARSFTEFSAKMIEDFGEGVRKYIRPAYEALRKRTDIDTTGMDPEEGGEPASAPPPATVAPLLMPGITHSVSMNEVVPELPAAPTPVAEAIPPPLCKAVATNTAGAVYGPKKAAWAGVPLPKAATPKQQTPTDLAKTEMEKLTNDLIVQMRAAAKSGKTRVEFWREKREEALKRIQSRKPAYNVESEANKTLEAIPEEQKTESPSLKRQTYQVFFNNEAD